MTRRYREAAATAVILALAVPLILARALGVWLVRAADGLAGDPDATIPSEVDDE